MKALALITLFLATSAAAQAPHPLDGRIWDTRSRSFVSKTAVYDEAAASRYVLLGEKHDSAIHHRLQLETLQALDQRGRKPTLAMEQFDHQHQPALAAAQAAGVTDAEQLADAGKLNRKAWGWPMYKDLITFAAERGWPLAAANLSRADAREIAMGKIVPALPPAAPTQIAAMEEDIVQGHCGHRPPQERLSAIVTAQRARDARMAATLDSADTPAVLITGAGHVRRDHAVPRYLQDNGKTLTIAYVETSEGKAAPQDYGAVDIDLLWFTARTERSDPCSKPIGGALGAAEITDRR